MSAKNSKVQIKLVKSLIGRKQNHIAIAKALRLNKMNSSAEHVRSPSIDGMINKISYLLEIKEL